MVALRVNVYKASAQGPTCGFSVKLEIVRSMGAGRPASASTLCRFGFDGLFFDDHGL